MAVQRLPGPIRGTLALATNATRVMILVMAVGAIAACGGGGEASNGSGSPVMSGASPTADGRAATAQAKAASGPSLVGQKTVLVNSTKAGDQAVRAIGALADGGYTVAWLATGEPDQPAGTRLYLQRFDAFGQRVAGEILVPFVLDGLEPAIAVLGDGSVLAAYAASAPASPAEPWMIRSGIYTRRFGADGAPMGGATEVVALIQNRFAAEFQYSVDRPAILAWPDGSYMVTWSFAEQSAAYGTLRSPGAQRYDMLGQSPGPVQGSAESKAFAAQGSSFSYRASDAGGYLFSYRYLYQGSALVRFYPSGAAASIPADGREESGLPGDSMLLALRNGGYVLWSANADGPTMQILDSSGAAVGTPRVPEHPPYRAGVPGDGAAYALTDGGFIVLRRSDEAGVPSDQLDFFAQRYDSNGVAMGGPVRIETNGAVPVGTPLADGGLALAWTGTDSGQSLGVYSQRLLEEPLDEKQANAQQLRKDACQAQAGNLQGADLRKFISDCVKQS